jgi:hypothetical protein
MTPLEIFEYACKYNYYTIIDFCCENYPYEIPQFLGYCIQNEREEIVKIILKYRVIKSEDFLSIYYPSCDYSYYEKFFKMTGKKIPLMIIEDLIQDGRDGK